MHCKISASKLCRRYLFISACRQMPKKAKKETSVASSSGQLLGPISDKNGTVILKILAKPGAKHNSITGIGEEVGVQIAAPPVDGEANTELVKYISKVLGVKKSQVTLDKGSKSRSKTLVVSDIGTEQALKKLTDEMDS